MRCQACGADIPDGQERCPQCHAGVGAESLRDLFDQIRTLRMLGQDAEALALCNRAIRMQPDSAEACALMGEMLAEQQQHAQAVAWFRRAVKLAPDPRKYQHKLDQAIVMAFGKPETDEKELVVQPRPLAPPPRDPSKPPPKPTTTKHVATPPRHNLGWLWGIGLVVGVLLVIYVTVISAGRTIIVGDWSFGKSASPGVSAPSGGAPDSPPQTTEQPHDPDEQNPPETPVRSAGATGTTGTNVPAPLPPQPPTPQIAVPRCIGLTIEEAQEQLELEGLMWSVASRKVPTATVEAGKVASTSPPAGRKVPPGKEIVLFVAETPAPRNDPPAPQVVVVPNCVGKSKLELRRILGNDKGLEINVEYVSTSNPQQDGRVLRTVPNAGASVPPRSVITAYVGRYQPVMPNYAGQAVSGALRSLQGQGYSVSVVEQTAAGQAGRILRTEPAAGRPLSPRQQIILYVSKAVERMPGYRGQPFEGARDDLAARGFTLISIRTEAGGRVPSGCITRTEPAAGNPLPSTSSRITLYVAQ